MKALTLRQPRASLVVRGLKTLENRSWMPRGPLPGALLIHASAEAPRAEDMAEARRILEAERGREIADWRRRNPGKEIPEGWWQDDPAAVLTGELPRGAVVGMVQCYDVVVGPRQRGVTNAELKRWQPDPWGGSDVHWGAEWWNGAGKGWRFTDAVELTYPVAMRGRQGLWECDLWPSPERLERLMHWRDETLAGMKPESDLWYLEEEESGVDYGEIFCHPCAVEEQRKLKEHGEEWSLRTDGGCHHEVEYLTHCATCGCRIGCCLTDYGIMEATKWMVNDSGERPLSGEEAWLLERCDLPARYLGEMPEPEPDLSFYDYEHANHHERKRLEAEYRAGLKLLAVLVACQKLDRGNVEHKKTKAAKEGRSE